MLLFVLALTLISASIAGFAPLLRTGSVDRALRHAGTRVASSKSSQVLRSGVAVFQIAVVLVLLVASGLMLRSFQELRGVEPGFGAPEDVLTLQLHIPAEQIPDHEGVARQFETIAHRLEKIPGVEAVAVGSAVPLDGKSNVNRLYTEGSGDPDLAEIERHKWIGGGFFRTLQIPLLVGEELSWQDVRSGRPAVVVSASLAREYWGSPAAALGQKLAARPEPPFYYEVVGVAADVRDDGVRQESPAMVYWPLAPRAFWKGTGEEERFIWRSQSFAIRNSRSQDPHFLWQVQDAIWEIDPGLALFRTASLERLAQRDPSVAGTLFITRLLTLASGIALLLGVIGVYGLISSSVAQRAQELGIRMAFGASAGDVRRIVLKRGLTLCALGLPLGLCLSLGLQAALEHLLFGVRGNDPTTLAVASSGLLAVVLAASYVPARRAAAIDPIRVIRAD